MDIVTLALAKKYTDTKGVNIKIKIEENLPEIGEKGIMYFVPNKEKAPDFYDEWMWINEAWEKIGNTKVDLSQYYTKEEMKTILFDYITSNDLEETLLDYIRVDLENIDQAGIDKINELIQAQIGDAIGGVY